MIFLITYLRIDSKHEKLVLDFPFHFQSSFSLHSVHLDLQDALLVDQWSKTSPLLASFIFSLPLILTQYFTTATLGSGRFISWFEVWKEFVWLQFKNRYKGGWKFTWFSKKEKEVKNRWTLLNMHSLFQRESSTKSSAINSKRWRWVKDRTRFWKS